MFIASGEDAQAAVFSGAAAARTRPTRRPRAPASQRRARDEVRTRLLASLGADQLQLATRRGAGTDIEDLLKPQCPTAATGTPAPARSAVPGAAPPS